MATKTLRAKRTTKKKATAPKRVAKKTTRAKKKDKKALTHATAANAFWVTNGAVLHNLIDLETELATIDKAEYKYHVNGDKNDFSVWVREVLGDAACADDLLAATTPKKAKTVISRHLKGYDL
jgi:hypothetical protein